MLTDAQMARVIALTRTLEVACPDDVDLRKALLGAAILGLNHLVDCAPSLAVRAAALLDALLAENVGLRIEPPSR